MGVSATVEAEVRQANVDLMNRYALALDTCDSDLLTAPCAEDIEFVGQLLDGRRHSGVEVMRLEGREAVVTTLAAIMDDLSATHHMLSNHMVEFAPDGASARAS